VKKQFEFKVADYTEELAEIKRIYNSEYNKTVRMMEDSKSTKKEIEEQKEKTKRAYENANALYNAKTQEMMKLINSANKLGVDYDAIMEEVKARKVINQYNLFEIEQGRPAVIEEKPY
jgi:UDP-N-acetylglucosamine pyrophosphorylase